MDIEPAESINNYVVPRKRKKGNVYPSVSTWRNGIEYEVAHWIPMIRYCFTIRGFFNFFQRFSENVLNNIHLFILLNYIWDNKS